MSDSPAARAHANHPPYTRPRALRDRGWQSSTGPNPSSPLGLDAGDGGARGQTEVLARPAEHSRVITPEPRGGSPRHRTRRPAARRGEIDPREESSRRDSLMEFSSKRCGVGAGRLRAHPPAGPSSRGWDRRDGATFQRAALLRAGFFLGRPGQLVSHRRIAVTMRSIANALLRIDSLTCCASTAPQYPPTKMPRAIHSAARTSRLPERQ